MPFIVQDVKHCCSAWYVRVSFPACSLVVEVFFKSANIVKCDTKQSFTVRLWNWPKTGELTLAQKDTLCVISDITHFNEKAVFDPAEISGKSPLVYQNNNKMPLNKAI